MLILTIIQNKGLNMSINEYLTLGYLAQSWAKDNLQGKNIAITSLISNKTKKYSYITADFNGYDLSKFYLENGLAFAAKDSNNLIYQNNVQMRANINELLNLKFVLLNLNSGIYHKPNCEFASLMHNARLILMKDAKNFVPCKSCLNNIVLNLPEIPDNTKYSLHKGFTNIKLYFTDPLSLRRPNTACTETICKMLVNEINTAENSIDMAIYGFGEIKAIFNALKDAKTRGVKVRAIVDYSMNMNALYGGTKDIINEFGAHLDKSENIIMHNKFFIFDDKKVLTGSANISSSGIGGYSANTVALIESEMIEGKFSNLKTKIEPVFDNNISVYFSPKNNIKALLLSKINSAAEEICVSAFYLTQREIIDALIKARQRGVKVFIIEDAVGANNFKDRVYLMRKAGIALIVEN